MLLNLTDRERQYIEGLLEATYKEKLHELHHTSTAEYRQRLKQEVVLIEGLKARLAAVLESGRR